LEGPIPTGCDWFPFFSLFGFRIAQDPTEMPGIAKEIGAKQTK